MKLEELKNIMRHIGIFHELMIVILKRRALFRAFEKKLNGKATKQAVLKNAFVSYYTMDYTRAQLIDLRKFFETDGSSYKVSFLIKSIKDSNLKKEHKKLFKEWKKEFKNQVNKIVAHIDKDYDNMIKEVGKKDMDAFIDKTNLFLDNIIVSIRKNGVLTLNKKFRYLNGDFLNEDQEKELEQYLKWSCGY